jgi:leucyl aminopeptidase (aminopeptidase T)
MSDLERGVTAIVRDCLGVREGEEVVVVANPATIGLGERLRAEANRAGAEGVLCLMAEREVDGAEPPASVAAAIAAADVVLAPTVKSLSHTAARRAATEKGVRIATLPGATEEMLARTMSADMEGLHRKGVAIAERLTAGTEARITDANGTDLRLGLGERAGIPDDGDLSARGAFGNLPCGEGFIAPIEGTA